MRKISLLFMTMSILFLVAACGSDDSAKNESVLDDLREKGKVTLGFAN